MALTLNDVLESRLYQRTSSVRRDLAEMREAAQSRRERFSLEDADRRAATRSQVSTSADARLEAARSRIERPSALGANASRPDAVKPTAPKADIVRPAAEPSSPAKRSEASAGRPRADTAGTEKTASDADRSETTEAEAAQSQGRVERFEASAKPSPAKPPVANPTGDAKGATAAPEQTAPAAEAATVEGAAASGIAADDEATAVGPESEVPAPPVSMLAVVAVPPAPIAPLVRGVSASRTPRTDGDAEIDAPAATTGGTPGVASATGPARGAGTAKPGFDAALAEISFQGTGDDAATSLVTQGAEPAGGAPATLSTSTEVKATPAAQPSAAATPATAPVPLGAVPMTIGLRALGASSRFEIRLDPKDLGRIDVSIDIDKDKGTVGARLVVDRPETLALLQRDASSLQQALAQTGLDASAAISLSLRSDPGEGQRSGQDAGADAQTGRGQGDRPGPQAGSEQAAIDLAPLRVLRGLGRIDIRI